MKMKPDLPSRETPTTIRNDGSRNFLHPADVKGFFTRGRRIFALLLIGIYMLLPWIPINGHPAVFLDVLHRRFHLFGLTFAAQDLWMAFFLITGVGFSLFFITSLLGRIWCGWACPHSVFLEQVFRPIERLIEGDSQARIKLDKQTWDAEKIAKRATKYGIYFIIAAMITHLFLAYFISIPELYLWMTSNPKEHWGTFVFMGIATGAIYLNFTWFREQLCLVICPYGRLQSALIDDDSVIIGYDERRGEPRGPAKKEGIGDCINCLRCVKVCPTGIDIRQGLQMECIGCANCIDACDTIMAKLNRPKGLIRYDSQAGLNGKKRRFIRPRIFIYGVLMLVGATAFSFSAMKLRSANMSIIRMTGRPFFITDTDIRNQYMVRVINKTSESKTYQIQTEASDQIYTLEGTNQGITVPSMGEEVRPVIMSISRKDYSGKFPFSISLLSPDGEQSIVTREVEFLGPDPRLLQQQNEQKE